MYEHSNKSNKSSALQAASDHVSVVSLHWKRNVPYKTLRGDQNVHSLIIVLWSEFRSTNPMKLQP